MPDYRRIRIKGSTIFITMVTYKRFPIFLQPEARNILHNSWKDTVKRFPFSTDAVCLLPDHIHAMITLPENDDDYSLRIREIKRLFTKDYLLFVGEIYARNRSHIQKNESTIWQRRFWEHTIRDERDFQNHFNYIHFNPVKHGLVENVSAWRWSSFHRYVRLGVYDEDWGNDYSQKDTGVNFGE